MPRDHLGIEPLVPNPSVLVIHHQHQHLHYYHNSTATIIKTIYFLNWTEVWCETEGEDNFVEEISGRFDIVSHTYTSHTLSCIDWVS
jgi:hypothetical protein